MAIFGPLKIPEIGFTKNLGDIKSLCFLTIVGILFLGQDCRPYNPSKPTFNGGELKFFKFEEKRKLFVLILSQSADAFNLKRALSKAFPKFLRKTYLK